MSLVRGVFVAFVTALRQLFRRRMTLRYPEEKLEIEGEGFQYDAKKAIGIPGYKGRHILFLDKCTGCQLCSIACENIADCIEMVTVEKKDFPAWVVPKQLAAAATFPQNKKSLWPQIDFGSCVFCGFCVDACPFDALYMTNEYELTSYTKEGLIFTPTQLAIPPKEIGKTVKFQVEEMEAYHG